MKAHGDYLQETIRNTPSELTVLDPKLTEELRAIVDHYGLLVIGWSGSTRHSRRFCVGEPPGMEPGGSHVPSLPWSRRGRSSR